MITEFSTGFDTGFSALNLMIIAGVAFSAIVLVWLIARLEPSPMIPHVEAPMEKKILELTDAQCRHLTSVIQLDSLSGNKESVELYNEILKQLWKQVSKQ